MNSLFNLIGLLLLLDLFRNYYYDFINEHYKLINFLIIGIYTYLFAMTAKYHEQTLENYSYIIFGFICVELLIR